MRVMFVGMFAGENLSARGRDIDFDMVNITLMVVFMWRLDGYPATGDMLGKTFQFPGFFLNNRLDCIRRFQIAPNDL
jgi:hypothetical protein